MLVDRIPGEVLTMRHTQVTKQAGTAVRARRLHSTAAEITGETARAALLGPAAEARPPFRAPQRWSPEEIFLLTALDPQG
jgi:CelD/BcsL family acetyltransferase involved in cellulose biosynthesis